MTPTALTLTANGDLTQTMIVLPNTGISTQNKMMGMRRNCIVQNDQMENPCFGIKGARVVTHATL
jgi:hypothetical protein